MRDPFTNPFPPADAGRRAIWEMLVARDIAAFLAQDWEMIAGDFIAEGFVGIDADHAADPDRWRAGFPTLAAYRDSWRAQAENFAAQSFAEETRVAIFAATQLDHVEIAGDVALAHKKFDGGIQRIDGTRERMLWQTLYVCRRIAGTWKIAGFTGYMPNPMGH